MKQLLKIIITIVLISSSALSPVVAKQWFDNGNFYQIYPRSFKDSDGDGIGDLKGITQKLSYLKELGVTGTWLSPIFRSPMKDFGYDISDYRNIQEEYGTMEDFDNMLKKCKELGIRLILDFVPNHTSDEHEWFLKSQNRTPGYEDFYIWHDGILDETTGNRRPPNNWISAFRFSTWEWNEQRQQYYYHQFHKAQPDLNYRNQKVVDEMKNVLLFWLEKGVSGFRCDAVNTLFEIAPDADGNLPDEPPSGQCDDPQSSCYLNHIYTLNRNETYEMIYQWRETVDQFTADNGGEPVLLMTEAYASLSEIMLYYGNGVRNGSHMPFNFELLAKTNINSIGKDFKNLIDGWLAVIPPTVQSNWVLGNHDQKRLASRLGTKKADLFNILLKTLPGMTVTYNGEEIAMTDVHISWEETVDPQACNTNETVYHDYSRDPARTPFQWDDSLNGGFSNGTKTWLPVATDYKTNNVKLQEEASRSHLKIYERLIKLRNETSILTGNYEPKLITDDIFVYKREATGSKPFVVVLNFGANGQYINLQKQFSTLPDTLNVIVSSIQSSFLEGQTISSKLIFIGSNSGLVLTT